jgi:two-component system NtrC family sensor kinase
LADLVEHREAVTAAEAVVDVYERFKKLPHEFLGVMDHNRLVGMVSRGQVGFLLGARFGGAIFGRQPIGQNMLARPLFIRRGTPILEVFDAALTRQGDGFHDDVALVDGAEAYLGMIPVATLVRVQTQMISEQFRLAETHRRELQEKNKQLFRSINELRQSRGRYDILFENSALGVALLDRHGKIETCNQRLESLLCVDCGEDCSKAGNLAMLIQENDRTRFELLLRGLETIPAQAAPNNGEFTLLLPGRGPRLFKFHLNWIQETGQVCVLLDDITEQRVLERRLQQKEKAALLESLVGGIAHEINNKLSPIIGFAELLSGEARRLNSAGDLQNYCLIIRDSALESAKIIRQLLQLSRPHKTDLSRCDLKRMVSEAIELLRFRLRNVDCQVDVSLPADDCSLMADATQIKQVIMNLIINAADAMEQRPLRRLQVRVVKSGKHYHLFVTDTGHGVKPEHLGRIFDPFFTTKSPDRGSGLGLSVCFSILKQHGGDISVQSNYGEGATFKVTLPSGEMAIPQPEKSTRLASGEPAMFHHSRVLVVDDEEFVASLINEALWLKLKCQVDKAADGDEAIQRINATQYDLIISDVRMPKLDGFGLLDWLRNHRPALVPSFMFITGDAGGADLNVALHETGVTVLRKPFDIETLIEVCRHKIKAAHAPEVVLPPQRDYPPVDAPMVAMSTPTA